MSGSQPPLLLACRLFQRVSAKGTTWFGGRLGNLKVVILENKSHDPDIPEQAHTHTLHLGEAPPYQPRQAEAAPEAAQPALPLQPARPYGRDYAARQARPEDRLKKPVGGGRTVLVDDPMPFGAETR